MNVLILGGTRFIGPPVVRRLAAAGHRVAVFHRGQSEPDLPAGIEHLHGDRGDLSAFRDAFRRLAPDVVLDMRPITEADALAVMETFRAIAGRVVAISSADVYRAYDVLRRVEPGPPELAPLGEDAPLREKLYPYRADTPRDPDDPSRALDDYDKILVERAVLGDGHLPGTALRLPMVYGEGDYQHRYYAYLKRIADRRPAILLEEGRARWRTCRGYVENVAAAIALAVTDDRAAGRIYNVADLYAPTEAEHARTLGRLLGWDGEVVVLPADRLPPALREEGINWDQDLTMDTTRIRAELDYAEPIPTEEALRRTAAWELANPPAQLEGFDYDAEDAALNNLQHLGGSVSPDQIP